MASGGATEESSTSSITLPRGMFCPSQKGSCAPKSSHLVFSLSTTRFLHSAAHEDFLENRTCIAEPAEFFSEELV